MTKTEVEALLEEFDEALVQAFPGPEPMSVLLVGGACFLLQGITAQPTDSVDVIIVEVLEGAHSRLPLTGRRQDSPHHQRDRKTPRTQRPAQAVPQ
jgi:hypothetical protein